MGAFEASEETVKFLCERLLDQTQPISERFRALFSLRNLRGHLPRDTLILAARDASNLLAHEAAFALGQMQDADAIPALESILNDLSLHPIVRHEVKHLSMNWLFVFLGYYALFSHNNSYLYISLVAQAAEALGAIGLETNVPLLKRSLASDPAPEVKETCELALHRIEEIKKNETSDKGPSPYLSVDPAAPASCSSISELRDLLLDEGKDMYKRYAALFALRNDGGDEAISAVVDSLGAKSALLRHEVAYVLGQMQNKAASAALIRTLKDVAEHPMVRHEAAEALGSIADERSVSLLEEFAKDPEPIVSQSCEVALSMLDFEKSGKSFEYLFMHNPVVEEAA
ncbi:Deoxyhypusine hydroxylase [Bienertia sinuspersici]